MTQHLTEDQLDRLLAATAPSPSTGAEVAARELATLTRSSADVDQRPRQPRRRLVAIAMGTVLLSGAGTVSAYELSIPPFQGLPDGISRVRPPIVAEYDGVDGQRHRCQVFPEFINLTPAENKAARAWASRQDWTGYGARLAAEFTATTAVGEEGQLWDAVSRDLRSDFAEQMVPGVDFDPIEAEEHDRAGLSGYSGICRVVPDAE